MSNKYVVIDLETTGNAPRKGDKMIQFAAVVIEDGKITDQYSSLVQPNQSIPPFIEELTGLTDDMVKNAPSFAEIAPKILTMLEGAYFVAHNVLFDLSFLQEELIEVGYNGFFGPILDTVELARILLPSEDSYKLSDLAIQQGLNHDRPHQADSDAYVTAELLLILERKLKQLPMQTLKQLHKLSGGLKSDLDIYLEELVQWKESKIDFIPAELEVYQGIALRKGQDEDKKPAFDGQMEFPDDSGKKEALFRKAFPHFEVREGQFLMMDSVYEAFNEPKHALIEAGTGVGKSLAYLIPSMMYAVKNNETIVISTYTTQLQDQLLHKDLPLLKKMLPFSVEAVVLKGRSHYISLQKFAQSLNDMDENYDTNLTKMQILIWLTETETGDMDELNLSSGGLIYWNHIKNDETVFLQNKSWISRDFYYKARTLAQKAHLIITNHSMLLTDLVHDHSILPSYSHVIVDEGHHFVKAAGPHFGRSLDYLNVRLLLSQIGGVEHRQLLYKLEKVLEEKGDINQHSLIHSFEMNELMTEMLFEMDEFFRLIGQVAKKQKKGKSGGNRLKVGFYSNESNEENKVLQGKAERFYFLTADAMKALEARLNYIHDNINSLENHEKAFLEELATVVGDLKKVAATVKELFITTSDEHVTWIEIDLRAMQNVTTVYCEPINVSNVLNARFFQQKSSVVLASATMTVKDSFSYILKEIGLEEADCKLIKIESPFDYEKQVKLIIPEDLPDIKAVSMEEYVASISEQIISIAESTKGRMLILFTSYEMLRQTHQLIKESGFLDDFAIFAQGISGGSRSRLTRNFQRFEKAILLGTSSFWEGVDIPGEDLSCLIIVRLPFSPPDEPMTEAKAKKIKEAGGNPFSEFSLPEAVIRFKQGFGRLIRTKSDKGLIIVFDRRIVTTSYGKAFLQSVPSVKAERKTINETLDLIDEWL
ncbi:ATP-dependent DNA helicase DinG [Cytobacillus purgationiresistens]|uniref:3'-5' exonuclease DinG n=1 Tax=Cytobacillus purgationiresistens TaxID=863449 RepID=A0ABU0AJ41_9BACI|nr:ATP-dependent DNA helicase DinG [Cytobacillus purgationiresistens]MDQ0271050.1 ATP-dependent DNA helicase DinG [Cytobacillus purgationiresistens]